MEIRWVRNATCQETELSLLFHYFFETSPIRQLFQPPIELRKIREISAHRVGPYKLAIKRKEMNIRQSELITQEKWLVTQRVFELSHMKVDSTMT
jgi:hypothetical protein